MQYKGPYTVKDKINRFDYKVDVKGKEKIYHANLRRRYVERASNCSVEVGEDEIDQQENGGVFTEMVCISVIDESEWAEEEMEITQSRDDIDDLHVEGKDEFTLEIPRLEAKETIDDVQINPELDQEQQKELKQLVCYFSDV